MDVPNWQAEECAKQDTIERHFYKYKKYIKKKKFKKNLTKENHSQCHDFETVAA